MTPGMPYIAVVQWAGGEFIPARGDSLLEMLGAIPGIVDKPSQPWVAEVFAGDFRIGIIDVRTGEVYDDAGIVVQQLSPELAAAYDKRAQ